MRGAKVRTQLARDAAAGIFRKQQDWTQLKREDIYRQRVFGSDYGQRDMIEVDDKKTLGCDRLFIYLIFVFVNVGYVLARVHTEDAYDVNEAVRRPLLTRPFDASRTWKDIESAADVTKWLLKALPLAVIPTVQHFNSPVAVFRFTTRRMQLEPQATSRWSVLADWVWKNGNGIKPTMEDDELDAADQFGLYRQWNTTHLSWHQKENQNCPFMERDGVNPLITRVQGYTPEECKEICQSYIEAESRCLCLDIDKVGTCSLYEVDREDIEYNFTTGEAAPKWSNIPQNPDGGGYVPHTAYWPAMRRFDFKKRDPKKDDNAGYRSTSGYVQFMDAFNEYSIKSHMENYNMSFKHVKPELLFAMELSDYLFGGMIDRAASFKEISVSPGALPPVSNASAASALTLDFVIYNQNIKVFCWVQVMFTFLASGHVKSSLATEAIKVNLEEVQKAVDAGEQPGILERSFEKMPFSDIVFGGFTILYLMAEIPEMGRRGWKYFHELWNWLTLFSLMLNLGTFGTWFLYQLQTNFVEVLMKAIGKTSNVGVIETMAAFEDQAEMYRYFVQVSSVNLFVIFMQLLHYLNDVFPRVRVLVDTMNRAMSPIVFLLIVIGDIFLGFVCWGNVMFGTKVYDFIDFGGSVSSCFSMLFGLVDSYLNMKEFYPTGSTLFFIPYMLGFYFIIVNLNTAIIATSYVDAIKAYEEDLLLKQAQKEAQDAPGFVEKIFNMIRSKLPKKKGQEHKPFKSESSDEKLPHLILHCVFIIVYVSMVSLQLQIPTANLMRNTVANALKTPIFEETNGLTGEELKGVNFENIRTRQDVLGFLKTLLPYAMYETSYNKLDGGVNPLNDYPTAPGFKQLVMNNWNIILGQKPVRITQRLIKMEDVNPMKLKTGNGTMDIYLGFDRKKRSGEFDNVKISPVAPPGSFDEISTLSDIVNDDQRKVISEKCKWHYGYGAVRTADGWEENGFVCMLDVDETSTRDTLKMMDEYSFITSQTVSLAVDFVVYNAYAEAFAYVAVTFAFWPSGVVETDLAVQTLRLEVYSTGLDMLRGVLELIFTVILVAFIGLFFKRFGEHMKQAGQAEVKGLEKLTSFFSRDMFNVLDVAMFAMCFWTLYSWYLGFVFSPLPSFFFFAEAPTWDPGQCKSEWGYCSDEEVICSFSEASFILRSFIRVSAICTFFVFFRLLKYFKRWSRMKVLLETLTAGFKDFTWFVLMLFVILIAFVFSGHLLFGELVQGFRNITRAIRVCFEMVIGEFIMDELVAANPGAAYLYFFLYNFCFQFVLMNIFFAVMDKNFQEIMKLEEAKERDANRVKDNAPPIMERIRKKIKQISTMMKGGGPKRSDDDGHEKGEEEKGEALENGDVTKGRASTASVVFEENGADSPESPAKKSIVASPDEAEEADEGDSVPKQILTKENIRDPNWHHLPENMQKWSLEVAQEMSDKLTAFLAKKPSTADGIQEVNTYLGLKEKEFMELQAEYTERAAQKKKTLDSEELKGLQVIHMDQESLSWYIMKLESQLKKLQGERKIKQDQYDNMVDSTKLLISGEASAAAEGK